MTFCIFRVFFRNFGFMSESMLVKLKFCQIKFIMTACKQTITGCKTSSFSVLCQLQELNNFSVCFILMVGRLFFTTQLSVWDAPTLGPMIRFFLLQWNCLSLLRHDFGKSLRMTKSALKLLTLWEERWMANITRCYGDISEIITFCLKFWLGLKPQ